MADFFQFDPLSDARWEPFVASHPLGGVFHSTGWLRALRETYGYRPLVVTTSPPGSPLTNGIVLCEIKSFLTGRRLVSLPFSDHCDPLVNSSEELTEITAYLEALQRSEKYSYIELRPFLANCTPSCGNAFAPTESFIVHTVSLDLPLEQLFRNTHRDSIQRKIRNAERDHLGYAEGRSDDLITQFYQLMLKTRRRHALPPQPIEWFRNLAKCMGDQMLIRVAYDGQDPIAAILNLTYKQTLTYKYSCSDEQFRKHGGTAFLIWKSIEQETAKGREVLDFGRSDPQNQGLLTFKDRFGSERKTIQYLRMSQSAGPHHERAIWLKSAVKRAVASLPDSVLTATGRLLYRHMG